jgi:phosphoribosylformylglycinamidine cyclo-ligase
MTARWPRNKIVTNEKIRVGDVIVGLAGFGQAHYESSYNSGLASNGLTSARHDMLDRHYASKFPESYDTSLPEDVVYIGPHTMTESLDVNGSQVEVGKLLLSPTRTFAPVMKILFEEHFDSIHGLVHCSGGGQSKCLKFVPEHVRIVKDNLFDPPVIFQLIQEASGADDREMYQVFNMGTRLEIYTDEKHAEKMISIAGNFGVEARIIGRVEESDRKSLLIKTTQNEIVF